MKLKLRSITVFYINFSINTLRFFFWPIFTSSITLKIIFNYNFVNKVLSTKYYWITNINLKVFLETASQNDDVCTVQLPDIHTYKKYICKNYNYTL